MKLKRFLLRYYPPGIILEYETQGELRQKAVDLLTLTPETDIEVLVNQIVRQESLISEQRKPQLRKLIYKLCAHFFSFSQPCCGAVALKLLLATRRRGRMPFSF